MFVGFKYNIVLAVVCMCAAVTFVYYLVHRLRSGDDTYKGWIPGFLRFLNQANETWIWIAQIVELQKSFPMISNSNQFAGDRA